MQVKYIAYITAFNFHAPENARFTLESPDPFLTIFLKNKLKIVVNAKN